MICKLLPVPAMMEKADCSPSFPLKLTTEYKKPPPKDFEKYTYQVYWELKWKLELRIHNGWDSWIFIFLFSLELTWGQAEFWHCAASTDSKNSRRNAFFSARGMGKRLLCAGDFGGDPFFFHLSFLSQPCSEARPSHRDAQATAHVSKTPRKTRETGKRPSYRGFFLLLLLCEGRSNCVGLHGSIGGSDSERTPSFWPEKLRERVSEGCRVWEKSWREESWKEATPKSMLWTDISLGPAQNKPKEA